MTLVASLATSRVSRDLGVQLSHHRSGRLCINDGAESSHRLRERGERVVRTPWHRDGIKDPCLASPFRAPAMPKLLVPRDTQIPTADSLADCQFENADCAMEGKSIRLPGPGETSGPAETMSFQLDVFLVGVEPYIFSSDPPPYLRNQSSSRSHDDDSLPS